MNQRVQWLFSTKTFIICLLVGVNCSNDSLSNNQLNALFNDLSSRRLKESLAYDSIEKIDVICDQKSGMLVNVDFKEIFNGTIYSQGYYNDPKCHFVRSNSNARHFALNIPYDGCGSKPSCNICSTVDNILIIQNNKNSVQDELSTARKITCEYNGDQHEKTVFFKPFVVDMLEVIKVKTLSGSVECWMDIGFGLPPHLTPITSSLKLGQDLTFTINLKQTIEKWDVNILRCYAYDDTNFDANSTKVLQISDENGCSLQKNIFGEWKKLEMEFAPDNTLTYYNTLKVFKFPDRSQVFLKCDIELCSGVCQRNYVCHSNLAIDNTYYQLPQHILSTIESPPMSPKSKCDAGSSNPGCHRQDNNAITTTARPTQSIQCYLGSSDPACEQFTNGRNKILPEEKEFKIDFFKSNYVAESKDPKVVDSINLKHSSTHKSTKAPAYLPPLTKKPFKSTGTMIGLTCNTGSNDPKCAQTPGTIIKSTSVTSCYRGSTDLRCSPAQTTVYPCIPGSTDSKCYQISQTPRCFPGSNDPKCIQMSQTTEYVITTVTPCYPDSTDPRCAQKTKVNIKKHCSPGSNDPKCLIAEMTSTDKICYPSSPDARCRQVMKSTKAPEYLAPTTRGRITTKTTSCFIGSTDPACLVNQKTTTVITPGPPKSTTVLSCYPGSLDPKCPQTQKTPVRCNQDSNDPNCSQNNKTTYYLPPPNTKSGGQQCYSGSTNPRCAQATKAPTTSKPICFPGSKYLGCPKIKNITTTSTTKSKTTPNIQYNTGSLVVQENDCYPGSNSPKCQPKTYPPLKTEFLSVCYAGSTDPRCAKTIQKPKELCQSVSTDSNCIKKKLGKCSPGSLAPDCSNCFSGSPDPRCTNTTQKLGCYPGSNSPRCQPATYLPPPTSRSVISTLKPKIFTQKLNCYPGSKRLECNETASTTYLPNCYTGSTDPRCQKGTQLSCYPGSPDPKCSNVSTTPKQGCHLESKSSKCQPATYLPPKNISAISTQQSKATNVPSNTTATEIPKATAIRCYPGSSNLQCPQTTRIPIAISTQGAPNSLNTPKPDCYPGSKSPKCQQVTYFPTANVPHLTLELSTTTTPSTQTTRAPIVATIVTSSKQPICYPGSKDTRCSQIITTTKRPTTKKQCLPESLELECLNCFPGSPNPRCQKVPLTANFPTTFSTIIPILDTTVGKPICYPGTKDVRCTKTINITPKPVSTYKCLPGSSDPACTNELPLPNCYTGSMDPRCVNTTQITKSSCYPGSPDPKCSSLQDTAGCHPGSESHKCQPAGYLPPTHLSKPTQQQKVTTTQYTTTTTSCYPGSPSPQCAQTTKALVPIVSTTVEKSSCYPGSKDARCAQTTITTKIPNCFPSSPDPRCSKASTTAKPACYPGSPDPICQPVTYLPPTTIKPTPKTTPKLNIVSSKCYQGSTDPRCKATTPPIKGLTTVTKIPCFPGSSNPSCAQTTKKSFKSTTKLTTTKPKSNCLPGSSNPECLNCYPGSLDLRCSEKATTSRTSCYPGSPDPKCQLATYLPPLTTKKIPKTTPKPNPVSTISPICNQDSKDPRCKENVPSTAKADCYPGSKSPKCQSAAYLPAINTIADKNTTLKPCNPGSTDTNCNKQKSTTQSPTCYKGSFDTRCSETSNRFNGCQPGSNNTNCLTDSKTTPPTTPTTRKPLTAKPTSPYYCYPGSIDPRCPDAGYKGTSLAPATYLPPLKNVVYDRTIRASKLNLLNGINQLALNDDIFIDLDDDVDEVEEQQFLLTRNKRDAENIHHKYVPSQFEKQIVYLTVGLRNAFTVA